MTDEKATIPEDPQEGLPEVTPLDPEPFPAPPEDEPDTKPAPEDEPEPAAVLPHG